jgi:hypothetical protein
MGGIGGGEWAGEAAIDAPVTGSIGPLDLGGNMSGSATIDEIPVRLPDYVTGDLNGRIVYPDTQSNIAAPDGETMALRSKEFDMETTVGQKRAEGMTIQRVSPKALCIFTLGLAPNQSIMPERTVTDRGSFGHFMKAYNTDWLVLDQKTCVLPGEVTLSQKGKLHLHRDSVVFLHCQVDTFDQQMTQLAFMASFSAC